MTQNEPPANAGIPPNTDPVIDNKYPDGSPAKSDLFDDPPGTQIDLSPKKKPSIIPPSDGDT